MVNVCPLASPWPASNVIVKSPALVEASFTSIPPAPVTREIGGKKIKTIVNIVKDKHKEHIALMNCMYQLCLTHTTDDSIYRNIIHNKQQSLLYDYESIASS